MNLKKKLIGSFLIISFITFIVGVFGIVQLKKIESSSTKFESFSKSWRIKSIIFSY